MVLWDFQIQTDTIVFSNQLDILVVEKQDKKVVVVDVTNPSESNKRKKEHGKLEKYQGLKEELVMGALGFVTPKLVE